MGGGGDGVKKSVEMGCLGERGIALVLLFEYDAGY